MITTRVVRGMCKADFAAYVNRTMPRTARSTARWAREAMRRSLTDGTASRADDTAALTESSAYGINLLTVAALATPMAKPKPPDPKAHALRQRGSLNPHPETVVDPLFADRRLLRRPRSGPGQVRDGAPGARRRAAGQPQRRGVRLLASVLLSGAAPRSTRGGLAALVPRKPGPRRAHKLERRGDGLPAGRCAPAMPPLRPAELARRVRTRFGRTVHPRSVERALARGEKKRR